MQKIKQQLVDNYAGLTSVRLSTVLEGLARLHVCSRIPKVQIRDSRTIIIARNGMFHVCVVWTGSSKSLFH